MIYFLHNLFIILVFMLLASSCGEEVEQAKNIEETLYIDLASSVFVQDATDFMELVKVIKLPEEVSNGLAASLSGFFYIEDRVYPYSTYRHTILSLSNDGSVNWWLKGGSSPINTFSVADNIKFDENKRQFNVYDGQERTMYIYDTEGEFVKKEACSVNFIDFEILGNSHTIYDASAIPNTHLQEDSQEYDLYMSDGYGNIESIKPRSPLMRGLVPFIDNSNFISVESNTYYKPNFGDTTFLVSGGKVISHMLTNFSSNNRAQSILDETKTGSVARKIFDEYVPYTNIVVPTHFGSYAAYTSGKKRFIYASENSGQKLNYLNTQFLRFGKTIVPVPLSFYNGYFFAVAKEDDRNTILEVANDKGLNSDEMAEKYSSLSANTRDTKGLYIYILKVK